MTKIDLKKKYIKYLTKYDNLDQYLEELKSLNFCPEGANPEGSDHDKDVKAVLESIFGLAKIKGSFYQVTPMSIVDDGDIDDSEWTEFSKQLSDPFEGKEATYKFESKDSKSGKTNSGFDPRPVGWYMDGLVMLDLDPIGHYDYDYFIDSKLIDG